MLAGITTVGLTITVLGTGTAHAATKSYVALGDSYSAGVGSGGSTDSTCYRSQRGYAPLIAKQAGLALNYQACSGATTADVTTKQLGALSSATSYVSMTIGGNDVGFANTIETCALPSWLGNCSGSINTGRATLANAMPARYSTLFASIKNRAGNAKVAIAGYPHIFMGEDCNALTFFSPKEESSINAATDELDTLISTKARAVGFTYVDPRPAFTGHAVCDNPEWINGLSYPVVDSYHPNSAGNVGYATLFKPALTGSAYATSRSSAPLGTADAERRAQSTTRGQAGQVLAMGLTSAANLQRAKAAGVDTAQLQRLVRQLSSTNSATVAKALAGLRALDTAHTARAAR